MPCWLENRGTMSLLDEIMARKGAAPELPTFIFKGPQLDENAQAVYDKMQELHPGERIEVEHWTVMRVYNEHGLCIDVRRSVAP